MRIGVYDEHWATLGGGEKLAATYAHALRAVGNVELLGHGAVDIPMIESRLDVELGAATFTDLPHSPEAVSAASAGYDLFVNCSFLSKVRNRAPRSVYVVHFPEQRPIGVPSLRHLFQDSSMMRKRCEVNYGTGFYPPEGVETQYRWTSGEAFLRIRNPSTEPAPVRLVLTGAHRPPGALPDVTIACEGAVHHRSLDDGPAVLYFTVAPLIETTVRITSDRFAVEGDPRVFGIQLLDASGGAPLPERVEDAVAHQHHLDEVYGFVETYDLLLANSAFTAAAVRNYWARESIVVHPGVRPRQPAPKRRSIVSVGRFFSGGHSKKQLELVDAFRRLQHRPQLDGWRLRLIGGASTRDSYVDEVRRAAEGLPIDVLANAAGSAVDEVLAESSIYWHAAGLGEDLATEAIRFEHFGISVVEAMSAGCIPIVFGLGGPAEIVKDGVNGLHFFSVDELVDQTAVVIDDGPLADRLRRAASARAAEFSDARFEERVLEAVRPLVRA